MKNYRIDDKKLTELQGEIDKWKKDHKNLVLISLSEDPFDGIFKVPTLDHLKMADRNDNNLDKNRELTLTCLLYPDIEEFNKIMEERSGITTPIADRLIREAGIAQEATAKKL